jgi:predicted aconitate hydratase
MKENLVMKILKLHLVEGTLKQGSDIGLKVDETLLQDATGTMAALQFEAMGIPRIRVKKAFAFVDHNMLQTGFQNADDHRFLQTFSKKYGLYFSKPGNGICHQVYLERFSKPGIILLGADSHTPNAGATGMIAIGAGGLDVAVAMAGMPYYTKMPAVVRVKLTGRLKPWVASKDIMFELLRRLTVKGGVGKIFEFTGDGVKTLSVPERATIANLGAELGATTSIFPSDERVLEYFKLQKRQKDFKPLSADPDSEYDVVIEIALDKLTPMVARPSMPDRVVPVTEEQGKEVRQVCIGSCNNSSYDDLMLVGAMLKGKKVHPDVSLTVTPGSKQVFEMIAASGAMQHMISAGARVLEAACGPCIGMGQAPPSGSVSIRTMNRNFLGRSGTPDDRVYLASPYVAAACAVKGKIFDPRRLGPKPPAVRKTKSFVIDDSNIIRPSAKPEKVVVEKGPNIKPLPLRGELEDAITAVILIKVGDNITTDHIMPAGARVLPFRSNIPAISDFVFYNIDPEFPKRAKQLGGGIIVGGSNYGQGSSREHAALAPMYLGVKAVMAKSYARIHRSNLINFGILPLIIKDQDSFASIEQGDTIVMENIRDHIKKDDRMNVSIKNRDKTIELYLDTNPRERRILLYGGLLNMIKQGG